MCDLQEIIQLLQSLKFEAYFGNTLTVKIYEFSLKCNLKKISMCELKMC